MTDVATLRAIGAKDMEALLDRCGIEYRSSGAGTLHFPDRDAEAFLSVNSFIVTMNTGYQGMAADLAGLFRYALKRGFVAIEDLPEVISPEVLPIIEDVLRDCQLEWPDGEIQTPGDRGIEI